MIEEHSRINAWLIDKIAKKGDIVLIEGCVWDRKESKKEDFDRTKTINAEVRIFG